MEKSFIVFRISWCVSGREHRIELHGNKCCVDHCIFRRTRVYVYTGKFYYCFGSIKVFILDFTFCITIKCISKIRSEFFYIKMGWSHSYFFVRGKCNTEGTMRNSIVIEGLDHCHDLGNSGFVICTEDGGSIGSNESSAF